MAKKQAAKKVRSAAERKADWERDGYAQLFVRVKTSVLEVLDEHVESVKAENSKGWVDSKYSRTEAVTRALEVFLGLRTAEPTEPVSVDQLELPGTEADDALEANASGPTRRRRGKS